MEGQNRIIEIGGIKMEVDLRHAKRIDTFKVGDPVKILFPKGDYSNDKFCPGVIVGFCEFQSTPAIEVLVMEEGYNTVEVRFVTITKNSKTELIHYNQYESAFSKDNIVTKIDNQITAKEMELEALRNKRRYFIEEFSKAFSGSFESAVAE